jgi:FMN-dependent NADH-azoreductase
LSRENCKFLSITTRRVDSPEISGARKKQNPLTPCIGARYVFPDEGQKENHEKWRVTMSTLLYIKASPRAGRSHSIAAADAFLEAYRGQNPTDNIVTLDVFKKDLPPFDGLAVQAKYTILHGQKHTQEEVNAWKAVEAIIEEFTSADKYVIAVPMWNFGIPYRLKHYIDILVQPGYTFSYSPGEGYKGLVIGKPMLVAYARGGEYPPGTDSEAFDLQKRYLELILGFMGFTDIRSIVVEPTLMGGPEVAKTRREAAIKKAKEMARDF